MRLIFKALDIENFMSIGKAHIDFTTQNGYTIVSGINRCAEDNAKSNGSGKSSLWEAISWVLTGTTVRGSKDIVNINANDGAVVSIDFDSDGHHYFIQRSKDHSKLKTNLKIFVDGNDESGKGIRDSEQILKKRLPDLTSSLIGSVIILGQGLPQRFTNNTPSGRKEVLETLAQSDFMITDLKNKLSSRKDELSKKIREYEDSILRLTSENNVLKSGIDDSSYKINSLPEIDSLVSKIKEFNENKKNLSESLVNEQNNLHSLKNSLDMIDKNYQSLAERKSSEVSAATSIYISEGYKYNEAYTALEVEVSILKDKIRQIDSIKDICPTCGQKIPNVNKPDSSPLKEKLSIKNEEMMSAKKVLDDLKRDVDSKTYKIEEKYSSEMRQLLKEQGELKSMLTQSDMKTNEYSNKINSIDREILVLQGLIDNRDKQLEFLKGIINDNTNKVKENEEKILYINIQKDEVDRRLSVVNKMYSYATRDFRGYLLSNVINYINSKAKEYCKDVFNTELLDFELSGNNILISYNKRDYENLSGGERQKIDLIVQFAIRDMLCKFLNFSSNIIILDELFDNLDSFGCQKILDLISSKLTEVENIYIVTHHSDISIPYDNEIIVEKGVNGISRII